MFVKTSSILMAAAAISLAQETFEHRVEMLHGVPATGAIQYMAAGPMAGQPVAGAPYSAEGVTDYTRTLADGTRITRRTTAKFARDGQGRTRDENTLPGLGPWASQDGTKLVTITDPVAKEVYILNEKDKTARRIKVPAGRMRMPPPGAGVERTEVRVERRVEMKSSGGAPVAAGTFIAEAGGPVGDVMLRRHDPKNSKTEQLGTQAMEGLQVTGTRITSTTPAGEIGNDRPLVSTVERWESADLKTLVRSMSHDPEFGDTTYRLTNISRTEPAKSLFQVPADYKLEEGPPVFQFRRELKK